MGLLAPVSGLPGGCQASGGGWLCAVGMGRSMHESAWAASMSTAGDSCHCALSHCFCCCRAELVPGLWGRLPCWLASELVLALL